MLPKFPLSCGAGGSISKGNQGTGGGGAEGISSAGCHKVADGRMESADGSHVRRATSVGRTRGGTAGIADFVSLLATACVLLGDGGGNGGQQHKQGISMDCVRRRRRCRAARVAPAASFWSTEVAMATNSISTKSTLQVMK